jgi:CheY-like chemotaxis protein
MDREFYQHLQVLVIDDEELMRQLIWTILQSLGFKQIVTVSSGEEALREIARGPGFDLVICDYAMRPMNGIEFANTLRREKTVRYRQVPIIMLSASTDREVVMAAQQAGVSDYVTKPISATNLSVRIAAVINHPRAFIDTESYVGPDRRRAKSDAGYAGPWRRATDRQGAPARATAPVLGVED